MGSRKKPTPTDRKYKPKPAESPEARLNQLVAKAFDLVERSHESGIINVTATSLRMINFNTFENEIISNNLSIIEKGITSSFPDFNHLMYAVVKKHE